MSENVVRQMTEKMRTASEIFQYRKDYFSLAVEAQKAAESEICDIYHYLELTDFDISNSIKVCLALKDALKRRREAKNLAVTFSTLQQNNTCKKIDVINRFAAFNQLDERKYTLRSDILTTITGIDTLVKDKTLQEMLDNEN